VQSQLELVKIWVVQGKVVAARALLEAIVQTGTHWQQQRALMMLDELSKDDGVDPS
jgi:FimV-like protein